MMNFVKYILQLLSIVIKKKLEIKLAVNGVIVDKILWRNLYHNVVFVQQDLHEFDH